MLPRISIPILQKAYHDVKRWHVLPERYWYLDRTVRYQSQQCDLGESDSKIIIIKEMDFGTRSRMKFSATCRWVSLKGVHLPESVSVVVFEVLQTRRRTTRIWSAVFEKEISYYEPWLWAYKRFWWITTTIRKPWIPRRTTNRRSISCG